MTVVATDAENQLEEFKTSEFPKGDSSNNINHQQNDGWVFDTYSFSYSS